MQQSSSVLVLIRTPRLLTLGLFFLLLIFKRFSCAPFLVEVESNAVEEFGSITNSLPAFAKKVANTLSIVSDDGSFGCFPCVLGVKTLHFMVRAGATEEDIGDWSSKLCFKFGISSERVCSGICHSMKKEVFYVISRTNFDPGFICSSILGQDCGRRSDPNDNWAVPLPNVTKPPVVPVQPPKAGSPTLRVLHLTDVHLDPMYAVGSNTDCGEFLCCRGEENRETSDRSAAGKWGDYRKCDTPLHSFENLLRHISETHSIDYVLFTGDDPPHDVWNQTAKSNLAIVEKVAELLTTHFPSIPIFSAIGNHEGIPVNSFPSPFLTNVSSMDWLYSALNKTWTRYLPPLASSTILKGAFYSTSVFPGLRIISLNMNLCNNLNWWLLLNTTDPVGQLHWLVDELQDAENKGDKVHIIGHIPPGNSDCMKTWSSNYYSIINRYESVVRAQFFGHTHMDDFEVFYDSNAGAPGKMRPTNVAYIGPSVTAYNAANPAYRIYTVDGNHSESTWAVLDHETYFVNLTEANLNGTPNWYLLYKAKAAYGLSSLQPKSWDDLIDRLEKDDWLFRLFYRHYHRASEAYPKCDTEECKSKLMCDLRSGRSNDPTTCSVFER